jgi:hypothetical protein
MEIEWVYDADAAVRTLLGDQDKLVKSVSVLTRAAHALGTYLAPQQPAFAAEAKPPSACYFPRARTHTPWTKPARPAAGSGLASGAGAAALAEAAADPPRSLQEKQQLQQRNSMMAFLKPAPSAGTASSSHQQQQVSSASSRAGVPHTVVAPAPAAPSAPGALKPSAAAILPASSASAPALGPRFAGSHASGSASAGASGLSTAESGAGAGTGSASSRSAHWQQAQTSSTVGGISVHSGSIGRSRPLGGLSPLRSSLANIASAPAVTGTMQASLPLASSCARVPVSSMLHGGGALNVSGAKARATTGAVPSSIFGSGGSNASRHLLAPAFQAGVCVAPAPASDTSNARGGHLANYGKLLAKDGTGPEDDDIVDSSGT